MNLTGILPTLAPQTANPAAPSGAQAGGPSFDQVLSQGMAQRAQPEPAVPPAPAPSRPAPQANAQPAKPQDAKPAQKDDAPDTAPTQQTATAGKSGEAKSSDAKPAQDSDGDANTSVADDTLKDIPGASQAALMMQLMQAGSAEAAKPEMKAMPKGLPAADRDALPEGRSRPGIAATGDGLQLRAAPEMLANAASISAHALNAEDGYARLMTDSLQARQQAESQLQQATMPAAALTAALQQTASAIAATQAPAESRLAPPVGSTAWDNALGQKVVWMASGGEQSASLTLNPPDLGPLQVVLAVNNNHATVEFSAPQPEVRQALEAALPRLKEMMSEAGIQLGQANVGAGTQGQFSGFDRREERDGRRERGGDGFVVSGAGTGDARVRQGTIRIAPDGVVDTFA
jgi:flagellar hook-length control protein FliK